MIWKFTYLLVPIFLFTFLFNVNGQKTFSEGVEAYNQKNYALAVEEFEKALATNENDVAAWYNLGLSNLGLKKYGEAIFNFEKVLKLTPNDSEAESKIEYSFGQLHPDLEWRPRLNSIQSSLYSLTINVWGGISIALSCFCALGVVFYIHQKKSSLKSAFLVITIFLFGCLIGSLVICTNVQSYITNDSFAVVTNKSIPTFIENSQSPKTTIPEGVRVEVIEKKQSDFVEVKTITGEVHVVRTKDLRFI